MKTLIWLIGSLTIVAPTMSVLAEASPADLPTAKALYASASYEEALAELAKISPSDWDEHIDEYRALCLVALGRTGEAEQALEHLVRLKPLYSVTNEQVSPRVVSLFETVKARTLPAVSRDLYMKARSAYDAGRIEEAIAQFRDLAELLSEASLVEQSPNLADIRELADGFLKLAEAKLAALAPRVVAPTPSPLPPPAPVAADTPQVFTAGDRDVTPPVEIARRMPPWNPPNSALSQRTLRGLLEVVTDTKGAVESATLIGPLSPFYDRDLLASTKQWKYRPAMKGSQPVKYRWQIEIVLNPH